MEKLLKQLNDAEARYVVIGGQAMLQQGMPRFFIFCPFCGLGKA